METAPAAEPGTSRDAAGLNKILNGLNTQVRAIETPAVGITRPVRAADAIPGRLNKIRAGLEQDRHLVEHEAARRLGALNTIEMGRECPRRKPLVVVLLHPVAAS
ncbi:hypothetical protein ACQPYA_02270 [Micromonospora sp. CA-263727]|uniref:hypothetical protein n=1 Tax=Micromonospora sp. CA-263727 TaxID=3239967 RepID=UPI003D8F54A3